MYEAQIMKCCPMHPEQCDKTCLMHLNTDQNYIALDFVNVK